MPGAQEESDTAVAAKPESESSWGELQDAGDGNEDKHVDGNDKQDSNDNEAAAKEDSGEGKVDGEAQEQKGSESDGARGEDFEQLREGKSSSAGFVEASGDQHAVGGDVVMVSPLGQGSDDEGEGEAVQEPEQEQELNQEDDMDVDENGGSGEVETGSGGAIGMGRRPNLGALMTMLVVSLRMQRLVHWVVRKRCLDGLTEENLVDLLSALEVTHCSGSQEDVLSLLISCPTD